MPVYITDKPLHFTSHDAVARARRALHTKRVGHTGTLDPLATGVLVLCVNDSTKLVQFMEADSKDYLAYISFGAGTATLDAEGPINERADVPELDATQVQSLLNGFLGAQMQIPPQYSAIQVDGKRAYAAARAGMQTLLPARPVVLHELRLLGLYACVQDAPTTFAPDMDGRWQPAETGLSFTLPPALGEFATALVWARVGSGTYLRSLARDMGAALGLPAHLSGLVRTRAGRFGLENAVSLEALEDAPGLPDLDALQLPRIEADKDLALQLRQGKRPAWQGAGRFVVTLAGELVAVVDADGEKLKVVRVWA
ncbi:tRNA pseudouridine(55) synthase TruB [Deinococcus sp.]|uniref:tRNA pseudouridine(55) synthase TruB n=1 Tax=Deinococcus sp. TaxID=47478 RepID=UPI003CC5B235